MTPPLRVFGEAVVHLVRSPRRDLLVTQQGSTFVRHTLAEATVLARGDDRHVVASLATDGVWLYLGAPGDGPDPVCETSELPRVGSVYQLDADATEVDLVADTPMLIGTGVGEALGLAVGFVGDDLWVRSSLQTWLLSSCR